MNETKLKIPKRIADLSKRPIEAEVNALEQEYMHLLNLHNPKEYDTRLLDYCFNRCDKLWKKIARRK